MPNARYRPGIVVSIILAALFLGDATGAADEPPKPALPKVVLLGDSIRLGYAPTVVNELALECPHLAPGRPR